MLSKILLPSKRIRTNYISTSHHLSSFLSKAGIRPYRPIQYAYEPNKRNS